MSSMSTVIEDAVNGCKAIYYFSVLAGTVSFKRINGSEYSRCPFLILLTVIYLTVFGICTFLSLDEEVFPFGGVHKSGIVQLIGNISNQTVTVSTIISLFASQILAMSLISELKKLKEIDEVIKKVCTQRDILERNSALCKKTTSALVLWCCYYLASSIFYFSVYQYSLPQIIIMVMFHLTHTSDGFQYWSWMTVLRDRFQILNGFLEKNTHKLFTKKYTIHEIIFAENLKVIIELHRRLTKMARNVNKNFYFYLLLDALFYYTMIACQGYIVLYLIVISNLFEWRNIIAICNCVQFGAFMTVLLLMVLISSSKMCYEANHTVEVLHGIRINPTRVSTRNLIISKSLTLMNNKLEIYACKVLKIDMALFQSIIASVTVYLVIMLQFDLDYLRKSQLTNSTSSATHTTK